MKTKSIILVALVLVVLTSSSRCVSLNKSIKGSKNFVTRDYNVGGFDKLSTSVVGNIEYTQSTDGSTSLELYGPDNIVELVTVDIKDSTLVLKMKKKNIKKAELTIKISAPNLQEIETEGVGNFTIKEKFETTNLAIESEGVGNVKINNIHCTNIKIKTEGVGNVSIQGKAEHAKLYSDGVGNIKAAELQSRHVIAESNGVGNISCYATESIHASANGVGNISYGGNPQTKQLKKNGIGSIKQK